MSLSGLKYDDCAYVHKLNESVSPGDYMLDRPYCDPCFVVSPGVNVGGFGASLCEKELIDVNSELLNITRKASDCPSKKYLPSDATMCKATHYRECAFLTPEDTLISNPKCTGKETTVNRWEWLCRQPQDKAIVPFPWFVANRTIVKDAHRPCISKPLPQDAAMPPKQPVNTCVSYLDQQFKEGQWQNDWKAPLDNEFGSVYLNTCKNATRL